MSRYEKYKETSIEWIGQIPEHWQIKRLKYCASINDEVLPEDTDEDYEIEYVDISSVVQGKIAKTDEYTFQNAPSRARRKVKDGDIIISTVRTYLKAIAKIKSPPDNLIVSTGFAVIRAKEIESNYLGHLFWSESLIGEIISRSKGVSYPAITSSDIGTIPIPVPPLEEQYVIANYLENEISRFNALLQQNSLLFGNSDRKTGLINEYISTLINEAVTGKQKVTK